MLRYHQIANDEGRVLALTSLTPQEFVDLLPPFTRSFYDYLDEQTVEGYDRVGRSSIAYKNSPLPTIEDKLLFILVYIKQAPTQEVQGSLFGMRQSKANIWIHLLHAVLNRALKENGDIPKRDVLISFLNGDTDEQRDRLGEPPLEEESKESADHSPPFSFTMGRNDR